MVSLLQEKGLNVVKKMLEEAGESGDKKKAETQLQEVLNEFYDKLTGYVGTPEVASFLGSTLQLFLAPLKKSRGRQKLGRGPENEATPEEQLNSIILAFIIISIISFSTCT